MRRAAALGDEAQERADAAADVEHALPRLEPDALAAPPRRSGRCWSSLSAQSAGRAPQSGPQRSALPRHGGRVVIAAPSARL